MDVLEQLAVFVVSAKASTLAGSERAILRRHLADVVAARLAGAACSEGQVVAAFYPPGRGADAVAGLATLVRLTETDDIHTSTGTTPSSVAVPVALALADAEPCTPEALESAIWVALEVMVRLGKAAGGAGILYKGVWPTRAGATLAAAAAASRVWGLSEAQTRNALSLAILLTSGRTGRFEGQPSGRWILFAAAVAAGVKAAEAARAGFLGETTVIASGGLDRVLGVPADAEALARGLGKGSVLPELSMKPYCTSRQGLPGTEAMRALIAEGLDPADIESFTIRVPAAYAGMISQKLDPAIRSSAYVSGAGLAAIAALDPASLWDVERAKALADPRIFALAQKGSVVAEPELDPLYPARWPARIEVRTRAGTVLRREVLTPSGDPAQPLSDGDVADKTRRVLGCGGLSALVEPLSAATRNPFESAASVQALTRLFVSGGARTAGD